MRALRNRLTYANVVATLALVIAVAGGTAYAANTVFSEDIVNGEVKGVDIGNNQVRSADVRDDGLSGGGLTGADIADQSGVDTCVASVRIGQLCFRAENFARPWIDAVRHCANIDMYAPTLAQAFALAQSHDLPNIDPQEEFWTGEQTGDDNELRAWFTNDDGGKGDGIQANSRETVCVATPTN